MTMVEHCNQDSSRFPDCSVGGNRIHLDRSRQTLGIPKTGPPSALMPRSSQSMIDKRLCRISKVWRRKSFRTRTDIKLGAHMSWLISGMDIFVLWRMAGRLTIRANARRPSHFGLRVCPVS